MRILTIGLLMMAAGLATAQEPYRLKVEPQTLETTAGEELAFSVSMTRNGEARASKPSEYSVKITPREGTGLRVAGGKFLFKASKPGTYTLDINHDSARAWFGARARVRITVRAGAPRPPVGAGDHRVYIFQGRALLQGEVRLAPGKVLRLVAGVYDKANQLVAHRVPLRWTSDSRDLIISRVAGETHDVKLREGARGRHTLTVSSARGAKRTVVFVAPGNAQPMPRPVPHKLAIVDADGRDLGAAEQRFARGSKQVLRAVLTDRRGRELEGGEVDWSGQDSALRKVDARRVELTVEGKGNRPRVVTATLRGERLSAELRYRAARGQRQLAVEDERGERVGERLEVAPGSKTTLTAVGVRGRVRWSLSDRAAGFIQGADRSRCAVHAGRTPGSYTLALSADGRERRITLVVGRPAPSVSKLRLMISTGGALHPVTSDTTLFVPRDADVTLVMVGEDRQGRQVEVEARYRVDGAQPRQRGARLTLDLRAGGAQVVAEHGRKRIAVTLLAP